ncbi:hypothetical protein PIB30_084139 [Stylosanthes scabra]|uniref:F-box domain-containing protein n=1 Tax=Stylosanthes scabra TaxID=79078 RepID=A0ABU6UU85_9FABA|nr:hypothetical protein [Stylosanthes scabra]
MSYDVMFSLRDTAVVWEEMDRISCLPKVILHDILGRLSDKDAAKTIVLSKSWRETWFSFPILSVCSEAFFRVHDLTYSLWHSRFHIFLEYVTKRLVRLRDQGLAIKELKLDLNHILDHTQLAHHVDQWIPMAIESGVEVLELRLTDGDMGEWYSLPVCLTEAKSLTKLVLRGGIRLDPTFLNHSLKFYSMKTLSLTNILFGDKGVMEHFISHCPLIEHLTLKFCHVDNPLRIEDSPDSRTYPVKSLSLHGLQKLKGVYVQGIHEVYIGVPNLENLCYHAPNRDVPLKLKLDSCTNLRSLSLWFLRNPNKWLHELFCRAPFLESLMLHHCVKFDHERINFSCPQLKFFGLLYPCNLKEVNIDAPNLLSCEYMGLDKSAISFLRISNQLEVNAQIIMHRGNIYSLREFVQNIKPQKLLDSLTLFIRAPYPIRESSGVLQVSSPPPSIKHLQLRFHMPNEAHYFPLMNWLLSSCCPETISFNLQSNFNMKPFIVFFYEMLMDRKKCQCYLRSRSNECCWHGLKVVKITHSKRPYENVEDLKAMLGALPEESYVAEYIIFDLES